MKFVDEYRDAALVRRLAEAIARTATRPWTVMEICGGQTHAIVKFGLDELLPPGVTLVHGPGCPVCVTPAEMIDQAVALALRPGVTLCSFGDMLRVPGIGHRPPHGQGQGRRRAHGLFAAGRRGVRARSIPGREVVFFAVGFETTAPANAMAVLRAEREGLANFSMVVSHVLVPPAMRAILGAPGQPRAGLPRGRPRLRGHGHRRVRAHRPGVRRADRRHGLRAGRHPRGPAALPSPARGRHGRGRERLRPGGPRRRATAPARAIVERGLRGGRPQLARPGLHPRQRLGLRESIRAYDAPAQVRPRDPAARARRRMHQRRDPARAEEAARNAPRSARAAPRSTRSGPRWSQARALAPPITAIASAARAESAA